MVKGLLEWVEDKVVVITGASSGIGQATANRLAQAGAKVVLSARRVERLIETVDQITAAGGMASYFSAEASMGDVQAFADFVVQTTAQLMSG